MQPKRYVQQLKGLGNGDVAEVDPAASKRMVSFELDNLDARLGTEWCYADRIRLYIGFPVNQPASGAGVIRADQLYRILESIKLSCDDLGILYGHGDITGPCLGLIGQMISNGYAPPFPLRDDIPTTDAVTNVVLPIDIPIGHRVFFKGHQTNLWNGFLKNNGLLEVNVAGTNVLEDLSTGATVDEPITVRAEMIYSSEPEARPPTIWTYRLRDTPAKATKHSIADMCQGAGIKGSTGSGKLAFLAFLSSLAGLPGNTTIDNLRRIYARDRGQPNHDLSAPLYAAASFLGAFVEETNQFNVYGDLGTYPYEMGFDPDDPSSLAHALFMPYFWPERGQEVSKLQEWSGKYYIEQDYGTVPDDKAQFLALEQSYLSDQQTEFLMGQRMGLPPSQFQRNPKIKTLSPPAPGDTHGAAQQAQKLRGVPQKIRARK
jgi:hypothetical protein